MLRKTINYPQLFQKNLFPGGKILIIDDNIVVSDSLQEYVEHWQGSAVTAQNGQEALSILEKETFDIIVVDRFMPEMDGETFIKNFRQKDQETPVIVISGQTDLVHLVHSIRAGIDDFLIKPFNSALFLYRLNAVYQKKLLQKQAKEQLQLMQEKIYPEFFYSAPLPMAIINLDDGIYYDVNPKTSELLSYSREELLDKEAHNSKLWDSRTSFDTFRQDLREKGSISSYETVLVSKYGKKIPALVYGKVIQIKSEPFIIASVIDNSHNKALDNILRFQTNGLIFLKETGDELLNLKNIGNEEIYHLIIRRVKEILGPAALGIVFGEVDKTETKVNIKSFLSVVPKIEDLSQKIFNSNFLNHTYTISPQERQTLLNNTLIPLGNNIYAAMFKNFAKEKVALLGETIGNIGGIHVIGFAKDNMLLAGMAIIVKKDYIFFKQELLEAYVKQAAIALKQRRLSMEKEAHEKQLSLVFQKSNIGMLVISKKDYIVQVNDRICEILGYTKEELLAMKPGDMSPETQPDQKNSRKQSLNLLASVRPDCPVSFDWKIRRKDGKEIDIEISLNSILIDHEEVVYGTVRDITLDKNEAFLKYHDKATRLPNFSFLKEVLEKLIIEKTAFTVFSIKLEQKKIKTLTQYHEKDFIDENYLQLAENLQEKFFDDDIICRNSETAPEEFAVLFKKVAEPEKINKLLNKLDEIFPAFGQNKIFADIGILKYPEDFQDKPAATAEDLLKRITGLVTFVTAKKEHLNYQKNQHLFFNKKLEDVYLEKIFLEKYLRENCYKKNYDKIFDIYYQPKVDHNFRLASLEALLRVKHPKLGIIAPDKFIDILEESGLIVGVERWLLQKTFGQLKKWQKKFPQLSCSVNIHPLNLTEDYVTFFTDALLISGLPSHAIELEIIERVVLNKENIAVLANLRALGIEISVDDFQTGTANITTSLKHLKNIVTKIKFDRSMIESINNSMPETANDSLTILESLIALCHKLGKKVIAEGIETKLTAKKIKEIGCDYFQGYVFSRPLSAKQLNIFLAEQKRKENYAD